MAVQTLTITGDGTRTGWDAEGYDYTRLQSDDGATSKIYSPTDGDLVSFAISNTSGLSGATINSVKVYGKVATLAAYDCDFFLGVRVSSTNYLSAGKTHNGTTYTLYSNTWTTNPNTSNAWTTAEIDAMEPLIEQNNQGAGLRFTYMYVEVDYTAGGSDVKSVNGVTQANIKSINGIATADIKSVNGITW